MKKIILYLIAIAVVLSLAACGLNAAQGEGDAVETADTDEKVSEKASEPDEDDTENVSLSESDDENDDEFYETDEWQGPVVGA